jgi:hypothetical protein
VKKGTPKDQLLAQINAANSTLNVNAFPNINAAMRLDAFYAELQNAASEPPMRAGAIGGCLPRLI